MGNEVIALGFCIVPSLLLRARNRLGLNPTQLAVLMQLCDFWWERDRKPYPSKAVLAERWGQAVMIGSGMQTKTPTAYRLAAEAGPGCTR